MLIFEIKFVITYKLDCFLKTFLKIINIIIFLKDFPTNVENIHMLKIKLLKWDKQKNNNHHFVLTTWLE